MRIDEYVTIWCAWVLVMRSCHNGIVFFHVTKVQRTSIQNPLGKSDHLICYVITVHTRLSVFWCFFPLMCKRNVCVFLNCDSSRHNVIDCTYCPEIITSLADACAAALSSVFVRMRRRTFFIEYFVSTTYSYVSLACISCVVACTFCVTQPNTAYSTVIVCFYGLLFYVSWS